MAEEPQVARHEPTSRRIPRRARQLEPVQPHRQGVATAPERVGCRRCVHVRVRVVSSAQSRARGGARARQAEAGGVEHAGQPHGLQWRERPRQLAERWWRAAPRIKPCVQLSEARGEQLEPRAERAVAVTAHDFEPRGRHAQSREVGQGHFAVGCKARTRDASASAAAVARIKPSTWFAHASSPVNVPHARGCALAARAPAPAAATHHSRVIVSVS